MTPCSPPFVFEGRKLSLTNERRSVLNNVGFRGKVYHELIDLGANQLPEPERTGRQYDVYYLEKGYREISKMHCTATLTYVASLIVDPAYFYSVCLALQT